MRAARSNEALGDALPTVAPPQAVEKSPADGGAHRATRRGQPGDTLPGITSLELSRYVARVEDDLTAISDTVLDIKETVDRHTETLAAHTETLAAHGHELAAIRETQGTARRGAYRDPAPLGPPLTPETLTCMPATALPELGIARVQRWCAGRVPDRVPHQVRVDCDVALRHLTIVECRAPWREDDDREWTRFPVARLRYTKVSKTWELY